MDIQKEREAFEVHIKSTYIMGEQLAKDCGKTLCELYSSEWQSWQAAKAQAVPEGFVLMPKEPTKEIVEAFWNSWLVEQPNAQTMFFAYKAMIKAQEQAHD